MTASNSTSLFSTSVFRLALVTVAIFAITAVILVRYIFPKINDMLSAQVLQTISAEAKGLREQFAVGGLPQLTKIVRQRSGTTSTSLYYLESGMRVKLAGNLNRLPPEIMSSRDGGVFSYTRSKRSSPVIDQQTGHTQPQDSRRRLAAGIAIPVSRDARLVVARDIEEQRQFARSVKSVLYGGFGLLLLIGLGGGLLVSRLTLRRIETVTQTSREIMAGDLSRRIPLNGSGDELDRLSLNLNDMLERIEQLMTGLREVSDNIAHDLKTPLNRLRNRAEAALRDPDGEAAYRDGLETIIEESDELIKTFNALLSIARLDAGAAVDNMGPIDLSAVVRDVGELYDPVADERGFQFAVDAVEGLKVRGNRQLIGQALANLIDNAIKYSIAAPDVSRLDGDSLGGAINLRVQRAGAQARITVADNGPGIPANLRKRALERFVRLDESRTRSGSGLGLSLVSAVVRLHEGELRLEDNRPGLKVVIDLPCAIDSEIDSETSLVMRSLERPGKRSSSGERIV